MRGSAFLVPIELADDVIAATRRQADWQPSFLRSRGLDTASYAALKPRVLAAATEPLTPTELRHALGAADDDQRPYFAMRLMAREGTIVRVGTGRMRSDDLRWVATEAWLGRGLGEGDPDAALSRLAAAYLGGYGPARVQDFAWWAGVTRRRATAAMGKVETVEVADGLHLPADLETAWRKTDALDPGAIDVLPKWDAYTMGYAPDGRARLVDDAHLGLAYSTAATRIGATAGDGLPLVLRGGRAVATWVHRLNGSRMTVTLHPFDETARGRPPAGRGDRAGVRTDRPAVRGGGRDQPRRGLGGPGRAARSPDSRGDPHRRATFHTRSRTMAAATTEKMPPGSVLFAAWTTPPSASPAACHIPANRFPTELAIDRNRPSID